MRRFEMGRPGDHRTQRWTVGVFELGHLIPTKPPIMSNGNKRTRVETATSMAGAAETATRSQVPDSAWESTFRLLDLRELGRLASVSRMFVQRTWRPIHDLACQLFLGVPRSVHDKVAAGPLAWMNLVHANLLELYGLQRDSYCRTINLFSRVATAVAQHDMPTIGNILDESDTEYTTTGKSIVELRSVHKRKQDRWKLAQPLLACRARPRRTGAGPCTGAHGIDCEYCILFCLLRPTTSIAV